MQLSSKNNANNFDLISNYFDLIIFFIDKTIFLIDNLITILLILTFTFFGNNNRAIMALTSSSLPFSSVQSRRSCASRA